MRACVFISMAINLMFPTSSENLYWAVLRIKLVVEDESDSLFMILFMNFEDLLCLLLLAHDISGHLVNITSTNLNKGYLSYPLIKYDAVCPLYKMVFFVVQVYAEPSEYK